MFAFLAEWPLWILLGLSALGVIGGDLCAKYWSLHQQAGYAVLAVVGYAASSFFYIPTLLKQGLVVTSLIWVILSIIGFLIIGIFIFGERLAPTQWIGVGLGIVAIIVLSIGHN